MHVDFRKILVMGLPSPNKARLAKELAVLMHARLFDDDDVRASLGRDLGFSEQEQIEQAKLMGYLCAYSLFKGRIAVADFVCPTPEARLAFGDCYTVWVDTVGLDTIEARRCEGTCARFVPPAHVNYHVTEWRSGEAVAIRDAIVRPRSRFFSLDHEPPRGLTA